MTHDPVASGKTIWKGRAFNAPALIVLALYVCAHIMFGQSGWTGYTTVYLGNEELPAGSFAQAGILMIRAVVLGAACFIGGHIRMLYR